MSVDAGHYNVCICEATGVGWAHGSGRTCACHAVSVKAGFGRDAGVRNGRRMTTCPLRVMKIGRMLVDAEVGTSRKCADRR